VVDQPDVDAVSDAIRDVAARVVLPRFHQLAEGDVSEKGPGDLVTVADIEAERELTRFLGGHLPGSTVIGEEAVSADPGVLDAARSDDRVWVIDPVDGTRNFVAGSPDFAVMVALVEAGRTTASWIYHPVADRMFTAVRGGGAAVDGQPLIRVPAPRDPADLHGVAVTRLLDPAIRARVEARLPAIGRLSANRMAAGINYPLVAGGELDFVFCWRTLVWDHAAGVLLLEEAGGRAARLDGSDYEPWSEGTGLVLAADPATHATVSALLAPNGLL
jgi:fructose-1,6-bisphosphatase/inositol monophosphatase family enzyme